MSVGYIASILRAASHKVSVVSPFAVGVGSFKRIKRPHAFGHYEAILRHRSAVAKNQRVRNLRSRIVRFRSPVRSSIQKPTIEAVRALLRDNVDVLMISAYTMYREVCELICAEARASGVPVIVGGPMFSVPEIVQEWLTIPGISAVYAGEPDAHLPKIVEATISGEAIPIAGLIRPGGEAGEIHPPLTDLDNIAFPDYADFPWESYPNKIIPIMTGRGCGWGVCTFCSDVFTTSGRTFRSRSPGNVLEEMRHQHMKHGATLFTFLDLKLNSNPDVWKALIDHAQSVVPNCEWTASVHVNTHGENGLGLENLKRARRAGLSRITTGLESGSRKIINSMARGTNPDALSKFVRNAWEAGISVRMTSIIGYPGETSDDVDATTAFLDKHFKYIDRIVVNRLSISPLTPLANSLQRNPAKFPKIHLKDLDLETGLLNHDNETFVDKGHQVAVTKLLKSAHRINRKPLRGASLTFEGVM